MFLQGAMGFSLVLSLRMMHYDVTMVYWPAKSGVVNPFFPTGTITNFRVQFYSPHRSWILLHNEGLSLSVALVSHRLQCYLKLYAKFCIDSCLSMNKLSLYWQPLWDRNETVQCFPSSLQWTNYWFLITAGTPCNIVSTTGHPNIQVHLMSLTKIMQSSNKSGLWHHTDNYTINHTSNDILHITRITLSLLNWFTTQD